jgi:hypothetical protein
MQPMLSVRRRRPPRGGARLSLVVLATVALALFLPVHTWPSRDGTTYSNPITEENQQPGSTLWRLGVPPYRVSDDAVQQIKGYASAPSVNKGSSITFYVSTNPAQDYSLDLYRIGYYAGAGGRLLQHLTGSGTPQPACPEQPETGLIACDWSPARTFEIPSTWASGIYVGLLTSADGFQDYIDFVVRDDERPSEILYQQGIITYEAYNSYPANAPDRSPDLTGKSLYAFNSSSVPTRSIDGKRATRVSFDRPFSQPRQGTFLDWDLYTVQWLEQAGYDVTYTTDVDTDNDPTQLLHHRVFVSAGHDEYWTRRMYDGALAARAAGVNLAFLGANAVYWQARLEPSDRGTPNRVIACYRDPGLDPIADPELKTVEWRSPDLSRPEQTLIGVQYVGGLTPNVPLVVTGTDASWAFADTGFVDGAQVPATPDPANDGGGAIVGYEADGFDPSYPPPPGSNQVLLSASPFVDNFGQQRVSNASLYSDNESGAWVFASGTMSWSWALARPGYIDARVARMTSNIFDRFVASDLSVAGRLSQTSVERGSSVTITAIVQNTHSRPARVLIDVAVAAAKGSVQFQQVITDQTIEPGERRTFDIQWRVPPDALVGSEELIVAAFAPDWSPLRKWEDWVREGTVFTVT